MRRPTDADYAMLLLMCGEPPQWNCKREPVTAARVMDADDREQQWKYDNELGDMIAEMRLHRKCEVTRTGFFRWCRRNKYGALYT